MEFQLWDLESGNWIATRDSESGALKLARDLFASDEGYYRRALGLVRGTLGTPDAEVISEGADLALRVAKTFAGHAAGT
jgi:hypothetical protein